MQKEKDIEEREMRCQMVGEFIKSMRQKAGITQGELADKLSYSTAQFVSNWERGVSLPPLDVLPRLCAICKIPPEMLVDVLYEYQEAVLKAHTRELRKTLLKETARSRRG